MDCIKRNIEMKPIYRAVLFVVIWKGKKMGTFLYSLKWFTSKDKKQCQIYGFLVFFLAVQQTRAQDFEKGRKRNRRQQMKGEIRRETDFVSLSDYVYHLQAVEPYQTPETKSEARSTQKENTACSDSTYVVPELSVKENTSEIAARLLFMSIHWAKNVRHFAELSHFDQVTLLQENWYKIFVINLVQWAMPFEVAPLVGEVVQKTSSEHLDRVLHNIGKLNEVVFKLLQLGLNRAEFTLLKALALFNPGKSRSHHNSVSVFNTLWGTILTFVSSF